jgi:hypothetical protein
VPSSGHITWLILAYRLPTRHGLKITIRRRLTAIGAVFPAHAVAAMPASPAAERAFRRIRRMIGEAGGSAQVLRDEVIEGAPGFAAIFNAAREREYMVVIAGWRRDTGRDRGHDCRRPFPLPGPGRQDAELKGLSMRLATIRAKGRARRRQREGRTVSERTRLG